MSTSGKNVICGVAFLSLSLSLSLPLSLSLSLSLSLPLSLPLVVEIKGRVPLITKTYALIDVYLKFLTLQVMPNRPAAPPRRG